MGTIMKENIKTNKKYIKKNHKYAFFKLIKKQLYTSRECDTYIAIIFTPFSTMIII